MFFIGQCVSLAPNPQVFLLKHNDNLIVKYMNALRHKLQIAQYVFHFLVS